MIIVFVIVKCNFLLFQVDEKKRKIAAANSNSKGKAAKRPKLEPEDDVIMI